MTVTIIPAILRSRAARQVAPSRSSLCGRLSNPDGRTLPLGLSLPRAKRIRREAPPGGLREGGNLRVEAVGKRPDEAFRSGPDKRREADSVRQVKRAGNGGTLPLPARSSTQIKNTRYSGGERRLVNQLDAAMQHR